MELMPAEEIFEVNSNSTTDTLKEQRLARNKELRLKATYLVSRRPVKNQQKEYNSESSSEFPASSPSNPQMQRKSQYQTRPPLLKNTLPADAFERGLALIATKAPQMTMSEKIESWQCDTEELSDVEDVVNFDAVFEQCEENKIKQLSKSKYDLKNKSVKDNSAGNQVTSEACYSFTEFQRRLLAIDSRKTNPPGIEQKHKFTSEEDEKPTTSNNCLVRNRDTPLKKRACKYKRAAEPIAHLPNKKSSSSDTPRDGAPSPKKKVHQQKISAATAAGENVHLVNEKMVCPSSSEASSQQVKNNNTNAGINSRNSRSQIQSRSKPTKINETSTTINSNWNRAISSTNNARNDEQESFFRWRRLSREIDKLGSKGSKANAYQKRHSHSPPKENQGLIQIRYDFLEPNNVSKTEVLKTNSYNVVVKPLKKEGVFKEPSDILATYDILKNSSFDRKLSPLTQQAISNVEETIAKTEPLKKIEPVNVKSKNTEQDSGVEFHQQHEFCNYLGLTGMSTANAMANAAAELSKCNLARRSLRVRHLEQRKAKSNTKSESSKNALEKNTKEKQVRKNGSAHSKLKKSDASIMEVSKTSSNRTSLEAASLKSEVEEVGAINSVPVEDIKNPTEKDKKIKILCQINASSGKSNENIRNESVEEVTNPRQPTIQYQNVDGNLPNATKAIKSKQLLAFSDNFQQMSDNVQPEKDDTKYIKLLSKTSNKRKSDGSLTEDGEIQTLHKKVQKCLVEARQNIPNIFIVQSLDSNATTHNNLPLNDMKHDVSENKFDTVYAIDAISSRSKVSIQSNKSTQANNASCTKERKSKSRTNIKRNANANRRLYTRSMLNLNQQRELRNRKVILKILKTYSSLKIKMSKANDKKRIKDAEKEQSKQSNSKSDKQNDTFETDVKCDEVSNNSMTLNNIMNNYDPVIKPKLGKNSLDAKTTNIEDTALTKEETNTVFKNKLNARKNSEHDLAISSNIITPKLKELTVVKSLSENEIVVETTTEDFRHDKTTEVAVQTDPMSPPLPSIVLPFQSPSKTQESMKLRSINGEMDVSSSDVVTSTTSGVGDQSRCDPKTSSTLVTKELQGNIYVDNGTVCATNAIQANASSANHMIETNNANVSINFTTNDLGIHALHGLNKTLRNPLQDTDGSVLYIFFEFDILIVVQESLVSFWKYVRVLNALMEKSSDEMCGTSKFTDNFTDRKMLTSELRSSAGSANFQKAHFDDMTSSFTNGSEWIYLGEKKRLRTDIEIGAPFTNRLCFSESRPVYIEMYCRELANNFRECNLLSCYVNVYYFNEEDQLATCHSIQLDTIQSLPSDVIYTAINDSRYFVLAWPQANVVGKVRSGLCKYALTPELDMLATTRDFKAMRHVLRSLECLNDGKLLGFGETQLTVWDHRSGDILMNYDLSLSLGRNLGTIYYPNLENGQNNIVVMIQHVQNNTSSDLLIIACTISHANPSRRILRRYKLPTPTFFNIQNSVNIGEHFIIQSGTGEEIVISCNDPHQLMFVPAQRSEHFYARGRCQVIELTKQTLTVDSFSSYLLKIAAEENNQKNKIHKDLCI